MFFISRFIQIISSLKFAIILIIFIAFSSGLGTFIPQGETHDKYIEIFNASPFLGYLDGYKILNLGLDHIYTSFWFLLSLIILCISLASCSFKRQIPGLKRSLKWIEYDSEKNFKKLELAISWKMQEGKKYIENSNQLLKKNGWENLVSKNKISARKGVIGKLGPIIVHIGLIILLVGSAYGNLTRQSNEQFLKINESIRLTNEKSNETLIIKLKEFFIEREADGKPKQFVSNLDFISENTQESNPYSIQVNKPIRYDGLTIYQADWAISNIILKIDDILYQLQVKEIPEIGEQIWGVVVEIGQKNKKNFLFTVDSEKGPIKVVDVKTFSEINLFLDTKPVEINDTKIELIKIIPMSGLIIKRDPSIPFIYFSFILIITGTVLSLIPTKQLWILLSEDSKYLYVGGISNRNLLGFKSEFLELSNQIKNA